MTGPNQKDLRRRLSRLGRAKRSTSDSSKMAPQHVRGLPPGEQLHTPSGTSYRIESLFAQQHIHGEHPLHQLLTLSGSLAAEIARQPEFQDLDLSRLAFIDTETTGLAGGAGTLAFLVGVGTFTPDGFRLRQYFLRDPAEEQSMLEGLLEDLTSAQGFVTYNGRAFDLPLLDARYTIALRRRLALNQRPHLDLLFPARNLWRRSLPDCRLLTVEKHILGVRRTGEDVPGAWIPRMYQDYLRTGNAADMQRVIYHNEVDILSLVGLTAQILNRHTDGQREQLTEAETLALARWHQTSGRVAAAEAAYRRVITAQDAALQREGLRRYTGLLKQQGRKKEALPGWETWHTIDPTDPQPCIELAKYYEWEVKDLQNAQTWTLEAMNSLSHWPQGWRRDQAWEAIEHRLRRLKRKQEAA